MPTSILNRNDLDTAHYNSAFGNYHSDTQSQAVVLSGHWQFATRLEFIAFLQAPPPNMSYLDLSFLPEKTHVYAPECIEKIPPLVDTLEIPGDLSTECYRQITSSLPQTITTLTLGVPEQIQYTSFDQPILDDDLLNLLSCIQNDFLNLLSFIQTVPAHVKTVNLCLNTMQYASIEYDDLPFDYDREVLKRCPVFIETHNRLLASIPPHVEKTEIACMTPYIEPNLTPATRSIFLKKIDANAMSFFFSLFFLLKKPPIVDEIVLNIFRFFDERALGSIEVAYAFLKMAWHKFQIAKLQLQQESNRTASYPVALTSAPPTIERNAIRERLLGCRTLDYHSFFVAQTTPADEGEEATQQNQDRNTPA